MHRQIAWRWHVLGIGTLLALLLAGLTALPATGTGPQQGPPPRPFLSGEGSEGGGLAGGGQEGTPPLKNSVIKGVVINWGYRPEPGVTLRLGDGGWELTQVTSTDGRYLFGPLGSGLAVLKVDLPPGSPLRPAAREVVVQTSGDDGIVANFALYNGDEVPRPPAHLTVATSPAGVGPGDRVTFSLKAQNDLPNGISEVLVTLLLPRDLVPQEVRPSCGTVVIYDNPMSLHIGRLVTVRMGSIPQGGTETADVVAVLDKNVEPGTTLESVATLLYAESVMDQAVAKVEVGGVSGVRPARLPTTGLSIPLAGLSLAAVLLLARRLRSRH
jgi:hypothetical protein